MQIKSEKELKDVAHEIVAKIGSDLGHRPILIGLVGSLGAGKTTLTKLILKELQIEQTAVSPTYVLHIPYEGKGFVLDHLDVYRLETEDEFERLKIDELINKNHLVLIEWADKFKEKIDRFSQSGVRVVWIDMEYGDGEESRTIQIGES